MNERKHITFDNWEGSFDKFANPGDTVAEDVVDYFMNIMPPASMSYGYLQVGEAYAHARDKDGKVRPTFSTFCKNGDSWIWCGNCFKGQTENIADDGDPWKG